MAIIVNPTGTCSKYSPFASVVKVKARPKLSVIATLTPSIPGSPGSWTPLLVSSSNTLPLMPPNGLGVGEVVGGAVGNVAVGNSVGDSLGDSLGDSDGESLGLLGGDGVGAEESREMVYSMNVTAPERSRLNSTLLTSSRPTATV